VALEETLDRKLAVDGELGRISTVEVVMRPPEVFVRPLLHDEAVRLKRLSKRAKHQCTRQRAAALLASNVKMSASQIAAMWCTDPSWVRKVIHEFNERGMDSLRPRYGGGRPRRITTDQRKRIVSVAGARPDRQGVPLTRWSLPRLSRYLANEDIVQVSPRHLGALLAEANLSFQRTRTWKASPDPDYEAKAARVLALCESPPQDGAVVSFDQMGPVSLRPTAGAGWARKGRPERQRADYNRRAGTRYVFGAFDVHSDRLRVRLRPRRRGSDNLAFMTQIRHSYPARTRIYWIQDNLSANWTPDIRAYAADNRIELVATPTYASYLNPVECHFSVISQFVVCNADYLDWDAFAFALARHVAYRNGDHRDRRLATLEARQRIAA
jgi:transposase